MFAWCYDILLSSVQKILANNQVNVYAREHELTPSFVQFELYRIAHMSCELVIRPFSSVKSPALYKWKPVS
jgi:hypothetical protein